MWRIGRALSEMVMMFDPTLGECLSRAHALKIYKTPILMFKDRDCYVTGEHRFRRGYSKNPRKMVKLWAEKEMRNLRRLNTAGIHSPEPIEVRENVLVMSFIGNSEGW